MNDPRRLTRPPPLIAGITVALLMAVVPPPVTAQSVELPEYTVEQRWQRAASGILTFQAALIELGREHEMAPEEVGEWFGKWVAQSWLSGPEARQFLVSLHRNFMTWPGASVEVLEAGPDMVKVRLNRPADAAIGTDGQHVGVERADFYALYEGIDEALSEEVGVGFEREAMDDHDILTLRTEYGPIQADPRTRWARGAFLGWSAWLELLQVKMEAGMTAREVGADAARRFGPGWTSDTPWRLYRGMTWNAMALDPLHDCEVLSASADEVRARCRIHENIRVRQWDEYDVSVEDVLEQSRAFAEGVAEQKGLRWEETWDGAYRTIRVTRR